MSRLPLQYLAAFRAAASTENLRAAAERLNLTHSAVSQQIRALETQLGFTLFERQGRRIVLNAAGHTLRAGAERAYVELEQALKAAQALHGQTQRSLRVTVLPSFAQRWLMPRLGRWHARHPEVALELNASQAVVDLERDGYHLALRQGRGPWTGLVNEPLFESSFLPVASPALAHRLFGKPVETLACESLLGDAGMWMSWFEAAGQPQRSIVPMASFNDAGLLLQAAEQGMGIALCRELLAADALLDGRLVRLAHHCWLDGEQRGYHLVYPPGLKDDPALRAFCDWLKSEIALSSTALRGQPETAPADR